MSTAYNPETDGASERTNKMVNQMLRYHVDRNQKHWVRALPRNRFNLMNTVNTSTGYSPFQLKMGRSPRIIPPPSKTPIEHPLANDVKHACELIEKLELDVAEAKDRLLEAKASQADQANKSRGPEMAFKVGDKVMLSTSNHQAAYKRKGQKRYNASSGLDRNKTKVERLIREG